MTDARLKSIIDRILRLKEEQDAIGDDIKDVYAEAKADGYNKTAIGQVVSHVRAVMKNREKVETNDADFSLYLAAYEAPAPLPRAHTHTRATPATNNGGADEVAEHADIPKLNAPEPSQSAASAATEESEDRSADAPPAPITSLPGTEADADPAPFALADARLISRVTAARRKGLPADEAGDSARYQRLVKSGALVLAGGRLFNPTLAPALADEVA